MTDHTSRQSHEINEVKAWQAGHEELCTERYDRILAEIAELKVDMKTHQTQFATAIGTEAGKRAAVGREVSAIKLRMAYALGAMAAASFIGGTIGPVVYLFIAKLIQ